MRFFTALSLFTLTLPALSLPSPSANIELTPAPVSLVPRTFFSGGSACNNNDKSQNCFKQGQDCNEHCVCIPVQTCPYYEEWLCILEKGTFSQNGCKCTLPSKKSGGSGSGSGHWRRTRNFICPTGLSACLIDPYSSSTKSECIDTVSSVDSCGGCTSEGAGLDCTAIPNVSDVSCEAGACKVYSCDKGFKIENGTSCVEDLPAGSRSAVLTGAVRGAEKFWGY